MRVQCVGGLEVFYLDLVRMALNIVENDIEHYEDLFSEWCSAPPPQLTALVSRTGAACVVAIASCPTLLFLHLI